MTLFEIPTAPQPRVISVALPTTTYTLRFGYAATDDDSQGWFMDIADANAVPIVSGIPLVTGTDLLSPYGYLGIPGGIYVATDSDPDAVPTFTNLGSSAHVYFLAN